jgi:hypothetical protein
MVSCSHPFGRHGAWVWVGGWTYFYVIESSLCILQAINDVQVMDADKVNLNGDKKHKVARQSTYPHLYLCCTL